MKIRCLQKHQLWNPGVSEDLSNIPIQYLQSIQALHRLSQVQLRTTYISLSGNLWFAEQSKLKKKELAWKPALMHLRNKGVPMIWEESEEGSNAACEWSELAVIWERKEKPPMVILQWREIVDELVSNWREY